MKSMNVYLLISLLVRTCQKYQKNSPLVYIDEATTGEVRIPDELIHVFPLNI